MLNRTLSVEEQHVSLSHRQQGWSHVEKQIWRKGPEVQSGGEVDSDSEPGPRAVLMTEDFHPQKEQNEDKINDGSFYFKFIFLFLNDTFRIFPKRYTLLTIVISLLITIKNKS